MIRSMTGYGRVQNEQEGRTLVVEVKSVNHRYKDIQLKLPRRYNQLEPRIRELVGSKFERGRLELYLNSRDDDSGFLVPKVNISIADQYKEIFSLLIERYHSDEQISIAQLFGLPDVIVYREKDLSLEEEWALLEDLISRAMEGLDEMRLKEGEVLLADINLRLQEMKRGLDEIETRSPQIVNEYNDKLSNRIAEIIKGIEVDPLRVAQEVAFYAERCDISEEIVRLRSHMEQFARIVTQDGPIGRKLDFLIQEMNREINTIGSKASDSQIAIQVVDSKTNLERLREQIQNIE